MGRTHVISPLYIQILETVFTHQQGVSNMASFKFVSDQNDDALFGT